MHSVPEQVDFLLWRQSLTRPIGDFRASKNFNFSQNVDETKILTEELDQLDFI